MPNWSEDERVEVKSLALLDKFTEDFEADRYRYMDFLLAVGNVTGKTYKIRRNDTVLELDEFGGIAKGWCIHIHDVSSTDEVLVLKLLIETEEDLFFDIANGSSYYDETSLDYGISHYVPDLNGEGDMDKTCHISYYNDDFVIDRLDECFDFSWNDIDNHETEDDYNCFDDEEDCEFNIRVVEPNEFCIRQADNSLYIQNNFGEPLNEDLCAAINADSDLSYFWFKIFNNVKSMIVAIDDEINHIELEDDNNHYTFPAYYYRGEGPFGKYYSGILDIRSGRYDEGIAKINEIEIDFFDQPLNLVDELNMLFLDRAKSISVETSNDPEHASYMLGNSIMNYIYNETDELINKVEVSPDLFSVIEYSGLCRGGSDFMIIDDYYICLIRRQINDRDDLYLYFCLDEAAECFKELLGIDF